MKYVPIKIDHIYTTEEPLVHKDHGLCRVVEVSEIEVLGTTTSVVTLTSTFNKLTIRTPVSQAPKLLRKLVTKAELEEVKAVLKERQRKLPGAVWSKRERVLREKLQSHDLLKIAEIMRDLRVPGTGDERSFSENEFLEAATQRIVEEAAEVLQCSELEAYDWLTGGASGAPYPLLRRVLSGNRLRPSASAFVQVPKKKKSEPEAEPEPEPEGGPPIEGAVWKNGYWFHPDFNT